MNALKGAGTLVRLVVRRDRIKLPVWILGIVLLLAVSASANVSLYTTTAERVTYATTTASSMVSRILAGPISGTNIGSIMMMETFLIIAVLVAFMSTLAVIRHTRQNEETGRAELIGSAIVGRHASMAAVLLIAAVANIIVGALCTLVLAAIVKDEPFVGALAYGASITGIGLFFTAIAGVAAQITDGARAANGVAAAAIGVAFLLRGIGDALGSVSSSGTEIASHWLSWASPFGWGFLMRPFVDNHWWVLGLLVASAGLLIWLATVLANHRDVGSGLVPARKGPANAARWLLSPLGLAWRLQRGVFVGWLAVMVITGVGFGLSGKEFESFFEGNEQLAEAFAQIGTETITDALFSVLIVFIGILSAAYIVQALLRMRTEETGALEQILGTPVSRPRWMMSHVTVAAAGAVSLIIVSGALTALTYGIAIGDVLGPFAGIMQETIVQIPAVLVIGGFTVIVLGLLPRFAIALAWLAFVYTLLVEQLGLLLELPQWAFNISPFTHTPNTFVAGAVLAPLSLLTATAVGLTVLGLVFFRRRDLTTS